MSASDFVGGIREEVIAGNMSAHRELFHVTRPEDASDPYWKTALLWFGGLDDAGREVVLSILRQVMVDTVSNLLAIVDGVAVLPAHDGTLELRPGGESLAGSLQEQFVEAEEAGSD